MPSPPGPVRWAYAGLGHSRRNGTCAWSGFMPCPPRQVAHSFGVPFLGIKDIANNELNPEPLQLEPEHTLANECSGVQLGLAAAEVTVGVIEMCAAA